MADITKAPFHLTKEQCKWVEETLASLSAEEKTGQVFHGVAACETKEVIMEKCRRLHLGGITFRADKAESIKTRTDYLQSRVKVPLLISANLENGGSGIATDATLFGSQLQVAATGNPEYAYMLGDICGREGASVGVNYAFAPVVDVHFNWRNPIINVRTYGDNPEQVLRFSREYIRGISKHKVAVAIKHFPGDGVDERDQHLLSSVNDMSCEEWDKTYGKIYAELIADGAATVMAGHILLPAYSRKLSKEMRQTEIRDEDILPASLSPELLQGLLREKLGFNGMIITDSASMTGLGCAMERRKIPAAAINAGCDMFLFGRNIEEDYANLLEDVKGGIVSQERLDEAVTRVLALKACLGLHQKPAVPQESCLEIVGCQAHRRLADECADKAVTLVKDTQRLLPVTPDTHKRVWMFILGDIPNNRGGSSCREEVIRAFTQEGFEVDCFDKEKKGALTNEPVEKLKQRYDMIVYIANVAAGGNNTVNRIDWITEACGESPQYVKDIPTMLISLGDPYHFVDAPMIRTIINCYENSQHTIQAVLNKITGRSPFLGTSPVDPFCGKWGKEF